MRPGDPLLALQSSEINVDTNCNIYSSNINMGQAFTLITPKEIIGPISTDDGPCDESNIIQPVGDPSASSLQWHKYTPLGMEIFCDPSKPPSNYNLLPNFNWVLIHGVWTLAPRKFLKDLQAWSSLEEDKTHSDHLEIWGGDNHIEAISPNNDHHELDQVIASEASQDSDGSESDFGEKINRLLHIGQLEDPPAEGTRRSEQKKKPSSRWNEEAGFLP